AVALGAALEDHARRHPRPGAALVISDFMTDPAEVEGGVLALRARGYGVVLLHVIGAGELEPGREFRHGVLRDVESGATRPIAVTRAVLERYEALLAGHLAALEALARRTETTYARMTTASTVGGYLRPYVQRADARPPGGRLVLVLDVSASMQAREAGETRFDVARRRARGLVDALAPGDEAKLVTAADRAHVVLGWTADPDRV